VLGDTVVQHRLDLLTQIIRLLLTMVPQQRGHTMREEDIPYEGDPNWDQPGTPSRPEALNNLLQQVPLP